MSQGTSDGAPRTTTGRLAQAVDYRLRGVHGEPTDGVTPPPSQVDPQPSHRRGPLLAKLAIFLGVAVLAVLFLQAFVIQPFAVPANAMAPTLQSGDRILVLKAGVLEGPIQRGEIVVFHPPRSLPCTVVSGRGGDMVLRVVALPGQIIWSAGGAILIDGRPLREPGWYAPGSGQVGSAPIRRTTLGPGRYFVLADNRADACDSRAFGPIAKSSVVGEGVAVVGRHGHVVFQTL
jgi:signal peptidase I